jgi:hypothetical protein
VITKQLPEMMHFGCNVISGIFTNKKSQEIAKSLGLTTLYKANYIEWANQNNINLPDNISDENSIVRVMGYKINQE